MDQNFINKLMREEPLTEQEEAMLDAELARSTSTAPLLKQLPDEMPSLAWRSELNERLLQSAKPVAKPSRLFRWLVPTTAVAAATIFVSVLISKQGEVNLPDQAVASQNIESQLVSAHRDSVAILDVSSAGDITTGSAVSTNSEGMEWAPSDLSPL
jgi:hypothetical protein